MGLREEKQRRQRADLIENAIALIRERGSLPPIRDLAHRCAVSEATIFNYFGHREAMLAEWAHRDLSDHALAVAEAGVGSSRRAARQVNQRLATQLEAAPALWLRVWSSATASDPSLGRPGGARPGTEAPGTTRLAEIARARGEIRSDQSADEQGRAWAAAWLGALSREARLAQRGGPGSNHERAGFEPGAWKRIQAAVELLVDGLHKRHERVRVRSGAVATPSVQAGP